MDAYKKQITKDQSDQLKNELTSLKAKEKVERTKEELKLVAQALGKPKQPFSAYILFSIDYREKSSSKVTSAEIAVKWKALSDAERNVYTEKAATSMEKYR